MADRYAARLLEIFERNRPRELLVDARSGERLTYGDLLDRSRALAGLLRERGVQPGEAVAFSLENCAELACLYFACMHAGARIVPINPSFHPRDYAAVFRRSTARLFFTTPAVRARLTDLLAQHPEVEVLCFRPVVEPARANLRGLVNLDLDAELRRHAPAGPTFAAADDDDVFLTMFTSGSSGTPKGIHLCYRGLVGNGLAFAARLGLGRASRFYNILAMTYLGGLYNLLLIPILAEGSLVLDGVFGPGNMYSFWERVRAHAVNTLWFSPTILSMLLSLDDGEDLSFLRTQIQHGLCGMAPLPVDLKKRFEQKFGFPLYENYGLSETTFLTTSFPGLPAKPGSVGTPLDGVQVQVVAPDLQPLDVGQEGQIVARTPYLMKGYDETGSASALPTGAFLTGDVGHLDAAGELVITGRVKDIIIRGGVNISPRTIEDVIYRLDGVQEAAVVGTPHPVYGEEVALVVRLRGAVTEADVRQHCEANIAHFQRPKHILLVEELPKGATGKIQKSAVRQLLAEALRRRAG